MQPNHQIFLGIPPDALEDLLRTLQAETIWYPKSAQLLLQGEENSFISILKQGQAHAVRYTPEGREVDYALLHAGDLFGDVLALSIGHRSPVSIYADVECAVTRFSYRLLRDSSHPYAFRLLQNLSEELTKKFFLQQQRIHYLTRPTLREKILAYLFDCQAERDGSFFTVPLNRSALASYLYCDRSALCRELSRLRQERIIDYRKNQFRLLKAKIY